MNKSNDVSAFLLVTYAAFFFALSEFIARFVLQVVSIDVYTAWRLVFGLFLTYILIWRTASLRQILAQLHVILLRNPKILPLVTRAILWPATVVFLGISFAYSTSQTAAYAFFTLHPLFAVVITAVFFGVLPEKPIKNLACMLTVVVGVVLFAIGDIEQQARLPDAPIDPGVVYTIGLLGGLFFAASNAISGFLASDQGGAPIDTRYIHLTTYAGGFAVLPLLALLLWSLDLPALSLDFSAANQLQYEMTLGIIRIEEIFPLTVIMFALLIGIFGTVANNFLVDGIHKATEKRKGVVTSLELLSIPIATVLEFLVLRPRVEMSLLSLSGVVLIILGAMAITAMNSK